MHHPLTLQTPNKPQTIYFELDSSCLKSLKKYDKILLVIDSRLSNDAGVQNVRVGIKQKHLNSSETWININNHLKNMEGLLSLIDVMSANGLTRQSAVIGIGGGATADLVGVAASLYMRGIDYAIVATSFISMADGIISKVAVNNHNLKNLIGAFNSPCWILADTSLLDLEAFDAIAHGFVEVWKHALLENSKERKNQIAEMLLRGEASEAELKEVCRWSMQAKAKYVLEDWEDTKGIHKALSLGHTLANYLEMAAPIHHSEAVLAGILFETIIARNKGYVTDTYFEEVKFMTQKFDTYFKVLGTLLPLMHQDSILESLQRDKISTASEIRLVLPTETGYIIDAISSREISKAVEEFYKPNLLIKQ